MDLLLVAFKAVSKILFMVCIGVIGDRIGVLNSDVCAKMTKVMHYLFTPFMIVNGFFLEYNAEKVFGLKMTLVFTVIIHAIGIVLSKIMVKRNSPSRIVEEASIIYANCGFMGVPLGQTMFGQEGVFYMSIHASMAPLYMWTYSAVLFTGKADKKALKNIVTNPSIWAALIGIVIYTLQIPVPEIIKSPIASIGGCASPMALVLAGSMISRADLKSALKMSKTYIVCLGKLIIMPLIMMFVLKYLPGPIMARTCGLVAAACPCATNVQIAAQLYGNDEKTASLFFGVSTVISLLTIPLMVSLFGLI